MRIGIYHGYELTGSGSNEYTRYLAKSLVAKGHEVHIICRESVPDKIPSITHAYSTKSDGKVETLFIRENGSTGCILHQLPHGDVRPVYLIDKQRQGRVKPFIDLTDEELKDYHDTNEKLLIKILSQIKLDVLHANHLIYQPVAALEACKKTQTPLIIYPHGSSIEYTIKLDERFKKLALKAILECTGMIIGNREVQNRIINLYPEHKETILSKSKIVGVGVDTSLFKPVAKSDRQASIQRLIHTKGGGGKRPNLTEDLR